MSDNLIDEFKEGIISPILGVIISLMLYVFTIVVNSLRNLSSNNNFMKNMIITPDTFLLFLAIFIVALTIVEALKDASQSYYSPSSGIARIIGTVCGTILFWGVLIQITTMSGGSQFDVIVASILAIGAPILGICLRYKLQNK